MRFRRLAISTIVLGVVAGLVACGGSDEVETRDDALAAVDPTSAAAPAVVGRRTGLETQWWVVGDTLGTISAVAALADGPLDAASADRLAAAGVRIRTVQVPELDALRTAVAPIGGPDLRQWLGVVTEWRELAAGPRRRVLDAGQGPTVARGQPRIAARCYPLPGDAPGTVRLRMELVVEAAGVGRVAAAWSAEPGVAYVIVPERPGTDWGELLGQPRPESEAEARTPLPADAPLGPRAPVVDTIGEAVLVAGDRRALLVLRPHVPEGFGLLPR